MTPLLSTYGVVIFPKGSRFYHASFNQYCNLPKKPMLFTTLHPSEWYSQDSYISVIELQRDIRVLFMIQLIRNYRIYSALNNLLEYSNTNLAKMNESKLKEWVTYLKNENLDGWLTSIENKTTIEIAIRMDSSILKIVECNPIQMNWINSKYLNNTIIPKQWGSLYPITTTKAPVKIIINKHFKEQIEKYQTDMAEEEPQGTTFSILLENADIQYLDSPMEKVSWLKKNLPSQLFLEAPQ